MPRVPRKPKPQPVLVEFFDDAGRACAETGSASVKGNEITVTPPADANSVRVFMPLSPTTTIKVKES